VLNNNVLLTVSIENRTVCAFTSNPKLRNCFIQYTHQNSNSETVLYNTNTTLICDLHKESWSQRQEIKDSLYQSFSLTFASIRIQICLSYCAIVSLKLSVACEESFRLDFLGSNQYTECILFVCMRQLFQQQISAVLDQKPLLVHALR